MPKYTFTRTDTFFVEIEADNVEDAQVIADTTTIFELKDDDIVAGEWVMYSFDIEYDDKEE